MPVDFRDVSLAPLDNFTASAPGGAIIGIVGLDHSGIKQLLQIAGGAAHPVAGGVLAPPARRYFGIGDAIDLAQADVIALDHALAMQDALARVQALSALERLRRRGAAILLASHELSLLELVSDEIWWLDAGRMAAKGDPKSTLAQYREYAASRIREWGEAVHVRIEPAYRHGDGRAEVLSIETLDSNGTPTIVWTSEEMVQVRVKVLFHEATERPVIGMMIRTRIGFEVYGTNTELESADPGPQGSGAAVTVLFSFRCDLCPHDYTITVASHDPDGTAHDWLDDAVAITVTDNRYTAGVANLRAKVTIE